MKGREPTQEGWLPMSVCGCCGSGRARAAGSAQGVGLLRCSKCQTLRFEAVAAPERVYRDGYHMGHNEFGWDYASDAERGFEEAIAGARLDWIETRRPRGRLLDVGGGLGYLAAIAGARGWDAELLEPVPQAVAYARDKLGVKARCGGVETLEKGEDRYDVIAFVHALEHFPDALGALGVASHALLPGGHLFLEVPHHGSMARRLQGDTWLGWQAGEHVYAFDRSTLNGLLDRADLDIVSQRSWVPGWNGLLANGYAHFLGLEPALGAAIRTKRKLRTRRAGSDGGRDQRDPVPIREERGWRRVVFERGFRAVARVEERLGVGTNIQVLARPTQ
jgi:SAM-dependent methyltransferase